MIYQIQADTNEINAQNVNDWIAQFKSTIQPHRIKLGEYYDGCNSIVKQGAINGRPNYSVNVNMAKYIIDVATSYTFGIPITYDTDNEQTQQSLEKIKYVNKLCNMTEVDFQQGGDMATYGVSYQLVLVKDTKEPLEDRIVIKRLKPEQTFYVVDNTILENPICGVYFYEYKEKHQYKTKVYVYDFENLYEFDGVSGSVTFNEAKPHNMGSIPLIQCLNNDDAFSDIECITDLLDALSLAISNNTDNLQSIANAILAVSGGVLNEEQIKLINQEKTMNLPVGAKVEWIIKNINPEAERMQIDNLLKFLFQISQVPDLTDDAFGGNQSGVAMKYKLWGMDQLWVTKTAKYEKAVFDRLKILLHLLQYNFKNAQLINDIDITFFKNLPQDNSTEYQMVQALKGVVSDRTLLQNISIVEDVDAEIEELDKQAEKNADMYGFNNNPSLNDEDKDTDAE